MSKDNSDDMETAGDEQTLTKVILLVSDPNDPDHGELKLLDDPVKAEHVVETLLEAGYEQERIRVFTGTESTVVVTRRPVVTLVGDETEAAQPEPSDDERGNGHKERGRLSDHLPSDANSTA